MTSQLPEHEDLSGAQFVMHGKARYQFSVGTYVHRFERNGESWLRVQPARREAYLIDYKHCMHADDTDQEF